MDLFILYVSGMVHCSMVWKSEDNLWGLYFYFHPVGLNSNLVLAVITYIC